MDSKAEPAKSQTPRSYSIEYLKSFAGLEGCQNPPGDVDLRQVNSELSREDLPEWRRKNTRKHRHHRTGRNRNTSFTRVEPRSVSKDNKIKTAAYGSNFAKARLGLTPLKVRGHPPWTYNNYNTSNQTDKDDSCDELYNGSLSDQAPDLKSVTPGSSDSGEYSPASIDLGTLFMRDKSHPVLPMPAAPTLQDIEKDIIANKKPSILENFLTCEDVENELNQGTRLNNGKAVTNNTTDKVASEHILSMLHKENNINNKKGSLRISHDQEITEDKLGFATVDSTRTSVKPLNVTPFQTMPLQQDWPTTQRPNVFVQVRPVLESPPLVPQALHALQRLVDHQLHILNSIPGEVTPGMLHERLSRSILGYPATGTQLLVANSGYYAPYARHA